MSLKPSRRGLLIGMGATAADAVLPVQANTRDDPMELDWRKAMTAMRITRHPWQAIHRIIVAKAGNRLAGRS